MRGVVLVSLFPTLLSPVTPMPLYAGVDVKTLLISIFSGRRVNIKADVCAHYLTHDIENEGKSAGRMLA